MNVTQLSKIAVVAVLSVGIQACSNSKDKKSPVGETTIVTEGKVADQCPVGVESLWYTMDAKPTAFAVSKVDGVLRVTLGGYAEQILVNGEDQILTPKAKGLEDNPVVVNASCADQVILMTEKDQDGNVTTSEWRLNAEEALGNLTIKKGDKVEQVIPLRKNIVAENSSPF